MAAATAAKLAAQKVSAERTGLAERRFGQIVRDELISRDITTAMGNPNWAAFAEMVDDVSYETLRKAVTGEREPGVSLMERVAEALELSPDVFPEYQLFLFQSQFDPRKVGMDVALENLQRFTKSSERKSRK